MKYIYIISSIFLSLVLISCDNSTIQEFDDITHDPIYIEYVENMTSLTKDVQLRDEIDINISPEQLRTEFESSDDLEKSLSKYVKNADFYIETMTRAYGQAQVLQERYPDFKENTLEAGSFNLTAYPATGDSSCLQGFDTDIQECQALAAAQSIFCGLASPTLGGALICAAGVITMRGICGHFASVRLNTCIQEA